MHAAVVQYFTDNLRGIPRVRAFVMTPTLRVTRGMIEKLAANWQHDASEWQSYARIRTHAAYDAMLDRSHQRTVIRQVTGAIVVGREPPKLDCEGANGEISRDVAIRVGNPGYSAGRDEAVVFATMHECFSTSEAVFLLRRDGDRWRIVEVADLGGWGE